MSTLERAIVIAATAHAGRHDKAGAPYILHPLRMMLRLSTLEEKITAVLHDVIEDCPEWSLERLREEGFSETVIAAVDSVTRRSEEDYEPFVLRAAANPIGRQVKLADLEDNCNLSRISNPTVRDYERIEKYKRAMAVIRQMGGAQLSQLTFTPSQSEIAEYRRRFSSPVPNWALWGANQEQLSRVIQEALKSGKPVKEWEMNPDKPDEPGGITRVA